MFLPSKLPLKVLQVGTLTTESHQRFKSAALMLYKIVCLYTRTETLISQPKLVNIHHKEYMVSLGKLTTLFKAALAK